MKGLEWVCGMTFRSEVVFFFFQAEDGIRDYKVTGVQTCALPICLAVLFKLYFIHFIF